MEYIGNFYNVEGIHPPIVNINPSKSSKLYKTLSKTPCLWFDLCLSVCFSLSLSVCFSLALCPSLSSLCPLPLSVSLFISISLCLSVYLSLSLSLPILSVSIISLSLSLYPLSVFLYHVSVSLSSLSLSILFLSLSLFISISLCFSVSIIYLSVSILSLSLHDSYFTLYLFYIPVQCTVYTVQCTLTRKRPKFRFGSVRQKFCRTFCHSISCSHTIYGYKVDRLYYSLQQIVFSVTAQCHNTYLDNYVLCYKTFGLLRGRILYSCLDFIVLAKLYMLRLRFIET